MWWLIGAFIVAAVSLACVISTAYELGSGKTKVNSANFWGAAVFHGLTMIAAFWMFLKFLKVL